MILVLADSVQANGKEWNQRWDTTSISSIQKSLIEEKKERRKKKKQHSSHYYDIIKFINRCEGDWIETQIWMEFYRCIRDLIWDIISIFCIRLNILRGNKNSIRFFFRYAYWTKINVFFSMSYGIEAVDWNRSGCWRDCLSQSWRWLIYI